MGIGDGVGGGLSKAYQREKERTPALLDHDKRQGPCYEQEPWASQMGKWSGWALGKVSGQNDRIKNSRRMDGSKAGSWFWGIWVFAKFPWWIVPPR